MVNMKKPGREVRAPQRKSNVSFGDAKKRPQAVQKKVLKKEEKMDVPAPEKKEGEEEETKYRVSERLFVHDEDDEDDDAKPDLGEVEGEEVTQVHEEESEIPIEPFNLIQERKEGRFDHTGSFYYNDIDQDEDADGWDKEYKEWETAHLKEIRQDPQKAAAAKKISDKFDSDGELEVNSSSDESDFDDVSARQTLVQHLKSTESVARLIKRMRKTPEFDAISSAASGLLDDGLHSIYSETRERLAMTLRNQGHPLTKDEGKLRWLMTWNDPVTGDKDVKGPFSSPNMKKWADGGYFTSAPCWVRAQGTEKWHDARAMNWETGEPVDLVYEEEGEISEFATSVSQKSLAAVQDEATRAAEHIASQSLKRQRAEPEAPVKTEASKPKVDGAVEEIDDMLADFSD
eukprot:TRINITY_DN1023_c0_g1_i1.p1 TRINITY_DN1023_c0_g1~~TRINITY_DN1023_c0_g1_i1.p1  ORF type:complete len:402 (+),score=113.80 TRINITY_DN1023_c0_g1_i1:184-1389(+)